MIGVIEGVINSCVEDAERRIETPEVVEQVVKCGKEVLADVDQTNENLQKIAKKENLSGKGKATESEKEIKGALGKIEEKRLEYTFEAGIGQTLRRIKSKEYTEEEKLLKSKDSTVMWLQYKEVRDYFNSLDHYKRVNTLLKAGETGENDELLRALVASPVPLVEGIDSVLAEAQELAIKRKYPEDAKYLEGLKRAASICGRICDLGYRAILSLRGGTQPL